MLEWGRRISTLPMLCVSVYILFLFVQSFYMAPQPRAFTFWFQQLFVEERTKLLHSMSQMSLASLSTSGSSKAKAPILNSESLRINSQQLSSTVMNSHCSRHVQTAVALCYMLLCHFGGIVQLKGLNVWLVWHVSLRRESWARTVCLHFLRCLGVLCWEPGRNIDDRCL